MGIFVIAILLGYLLVAALLGAVVLGLVPRFTVTVVNIIVFVLGAILGTVGLALLLHFIGKQFGLYPSLSQESSVALILAASGLLIGGTALVWLKELLLDRRAK